MGIKIGQSIDRKSALKEEIVTLLKKNNCYYSVIEIRDLVDQKLLSNYKNRSTKTNGVRMILLRLLKKNIVNSKVFVLKKNYNKKHKKSGELYKHKVTKFILN